MKVSVPDMIRDGFFVENEYFYLKDGTRGGKLQSDGKLLYKGKRVDMHSLAANIKGVKARRLNGFLNWYVKRDSELVSIEDIREAYRKQKEQQIHE